VRFWDSSALVPLLVQEVSSWKLWELVRQDPEMILWWATPVECAAALARIDGEDQVGKPVLEQSRRVLQSLVANASEVHPTEDVRASAENLVSKYTLRAADSLQLAAALLWRQGYTDGASFITLDRRLHVAAALEGFRVLTYVDEVHQPLAEYGEHLPVVLSSRSISD
jgi:predicted nucleic acid-binding protein